MCHADLMDGNVPFKSKLQQCLHVVSQVSHIWMNLGCQKRLQSTSETRYMTSRIGIKFPTPYAWGSNSPPPGKLKRSNARGMPGGGMLKLRFERYIKLPKRKCSENRVVCLALLSLKNIREV